MEQEDDMAQNMMGMLLGAAIDRSDGDSGIKGAIIGSLTESALRVVAPLAITFAIGWAVQFGARKAWKAATGEASPGTPAPAR
jgi:Na+/serine symporter